MADYQNYGLLNNIASGIREAMIAKQTNDTNQHMMQMQNLLYGVQEGPGGQLQYTPEKQAELAAQKQSATLKAQGETADYGPATPDELGLLKAHYNKIQPGLGDQLPENLSHHQVVEKFGLIKPDISGGYGVDVAKQKADAMLPFQQSRLDTQTERLHNQNVKSVIGDPTTTQLINTSNNLKNAISNFKQGGATPQEFAELQQAVRSNVGIKGTSGVDERGETYLNSLGVKKDKMMQFLTGDPQSVIQSDPKFAAQIEQIANLELANKGAQAKAQMQKNAAAHKSFYSKHPDLRDDLNDSMDQAVQQLGSQPSQGQGLLGAPAGSFSSHPQDNAAVQWAKSNPNDPRSAKILQVNGVR